MTVIAPRRYSRAIYKKSVSSFIDKTVEVTVIDHEYRKIVHVLTAAALDNILRSAGRTYLVVFLFHFDLSDFPESLLQRINDRILSIFYFLSLLILVLS